MFLDWQRVAERIVTNIRYEGQFGRQSFYKPG